MKITIEDVAKIANVSKSTVSRVLNKSGPVSQETKEAVLGAVKILNYRPNQVARSLATKQTHTIGLIVPDIRNPYYSKACWYAERQLYKDKYTTVICNTDNDPGMEKTYLQVLLDRNVDGILTIGGEEDFTNIINFKSREDIPIVLVDREIKGYDIPSITLDNVYGGRLATKFLLDLGHSRIAFATSDFTQSERLRRKGYLLALQDAGIKPRDEYIISRSEEDWKSGKCLEDIIKLMNYKEPPTAIFASNDFKALRILSILKTNGFTVPDDVSLIGYDNIEFSSMVEPTLTTLSQPIDKMISIGIKMLLSYINNDKKVPSKKVVKPKLVERKSTKEFKGGV
ncbi:MAG: LacI family transcriptional regulator [Halanaerobiales bacterium]|nr:LacI family transcriptional regulator [Halanaerobiales bacterium]